MWGIKLFVIPIFISILFLVWDNISIKVSFLRPFVSQPMEMAFLPQRQISVALNYKRGELPGNSPAFQWVKQNISRGSIILADDCTSYVITAFADVYVAYRPKPGMGVQDFTKRRDAQYTFFLPSTSNTARFLIASYLSADYVIINIEQDRNFQLRQCYHRDIVTQLDIAQAHFTKLNTIDGYVIYKVGKSELK